MKALYLPGMDGEAFSLDKVQAHLKTVQLVPFTYPTGRDLSWDEICDAVVGQMKTLDTGLLVAESFGGAVSLKTTLRHPEFVRGLCLLGGFSQEAEPLASAIGRTATRVLPKSVLKPVSRVLAAWKLAGGLKGKQRDQFLENFSNLDHTEIARRLKLLHSFNVSDRLVGIHCPVDVIYGSSDPIGGNPAQLELWQRLPNARLHCLDGYGHVITAEVPIGVARCIDSWAERAEDSRAA